MLAMKSSAALLTPSTTGPRLEQRRWGVPAPAGMDPYSNSRHRSVEGRASRALLTCGEEGVGDAQTAFESGSVYFGVSGADSMRAGHGEPIVRVSSVTHLSDDVVDGAHSAAVQERLQRPLPAGSSPAVCGTSKKMSATVFASNTIDRSSGPTLRIRCASKSPGC